MHAATGSGFFSPHALSTGEVTDRWRCCNRVGLRLQPRIFTIRQYEFYHCTELYPDEITIGRGHKCCNDKWRFCYGRTERSWNNHEGKESESHLIKASSFPHLPAIRLCNQPR